MYVCMYVCMHACMHACMHLWRYACMYVCMYVCKLLNKRNPYLTSVAYYLDFGNCNPHYLVPNCSAINLESHDGNHKRFAQLSTLVGQYRGGLLPKVAVSLLLWSPSETICVHSRSHWNTGPVPLDYEMFSSGNHSCGTCGTVHDGSQ